MAHLGGECLGYTGEWIRCVLSHEKPFGIDHNRPFKPIKFDSSLGRKYPDLNHLAILSANIDNFQTGRSSLENYALKEDGSARIIKVDSVLTFNTHAKKITDDLIKHANQCPFDVFELTLWAGEQFSWLGGINMIGHAMAFRKSPNGNCHFMDANSGWYKFENETDFKRWLPFYLQKTPYMEKFPAYEISTYGVTNAKPESRVMKYLDQRCERLHHILFREILHLYYAATKMLNLFKSKDNQPVDVQIPMPKEPRSKPTTTYAQDDMQIGLKTTSSYSKIADVFQISLPKKQLARVVQSEIQNSCNQQDVSAKLSAPQIARRPRHR